MLTFDVIASGSSGNAYILESGRDVFLLDSGVAWKKIQKKTTFLGKNISACLITHEHGDHSKSIKKVMSAGIDVLASSGTFKATHTGNHHRAIVVKHGDKIPWGDVEIYPFATIHNAKEPLGYVISDGEDKILFATDTVYIPHRFYGLTIMAVECNYVTDSIVMNHINPHLYEQIISSHMSLKTLVKFIRLQDTSKLREIHVLHLSKTNSDEGIIKTTIQEETGSLVIVH